MLSLCTVILVNYVVVFLARYHVFTLLNKYKNDDTNLLISSYLAGNTSTNLYNTINKNLYNKLNKCWSHKASFSRLYLVKVIVQCHNK